MPFAGTSLAHVASWIFCKSRDSPRESRDEVIGDDVSQPGCPPSTHVVTAGLQFAVSTREQLTPPLPARVARTPCPSCALSGFVCAHLAASPPVRCCGLAQCASLSYSALIPHPNPLPRVTAPRNVAPKLEEGVRYDTAPPLLATLRLPEISDDARHRSAMLQRGKRESPANLGASAASRLPRPDLSGAVAGEIQPPGDGQTDAVSLLSYRRVHMCMCMSMCMCMWNADGAEHVGLSSHMDVHMHVHV